MNKNYNILDLESNIGIYYNNIDQWIYADWTSNQTKESAINGYEMILKCMLTKQCHKVLNDYSHVNCLWHEASDWITNEWFIRMNAAGLKYLAWISSGNPTCNLTTQQIIRCNTNKCITISFDDIETAKAWLKTV